MIIESGGADHWQVYPRVTFGALPDDVLLEIFDFYLALLSHWFRRYPEDAWHTLVHVCKHWRSIIFASPHRLQLQLLCTNKRSVQEALDIWPQFPIVIIGRLGMSNPQDANNPIVAFTQHTRVIKIDMDHIPHPLLTGMQAVKMKNPFSTLTYLRLISTQINAPALPDFFLGGSAPRLQELYLDGIPFPHYQTYFSLPVNSLSFAFGTFLFPDIFHPTQWSLASLR
jgi:hypothetical protein